MLAALEQGVKAGKWYSLIDKLHSESTLRAAFMQVAANRGAAGVDHVSIEHYAKDLDANLRRPSEELRTGEYRPQQIRRRYTLRGWFEYFKHSHHLTFRTYECLVRRRLRSILCRRSHRKGSA
jgi:hypothetical protein